MISVDRSAIRQCLSTTKVLVKVPTTSTIFIDIFFFTFTCTAASLGDGIIFSLAVRWVWHLI